MGAEITQTINRTLFALFGWFMQPRTTQTLLDNAWTTNRNYKALIFWHLLWAVALRVIVNVFSCKAELFPFMHINCTIFIREMGTTVSLFCCSVWVFFSLLSSSRITQPHLSRIESVCRAQQNGANTLMEVYLTRHANICFPMISI